MSNTNVILDVQSEYKILFIIISHYAFRLSQKYFAFNFVLKQIKMQ
jgi:hypothetical protein